MKNFLTALLLLCLLIEHCSAAHVGPELLNAVDVGDYKDGSVLIGVVRGLTIESTKQVLNLRRRIEERTKEKDLARKSVDDAEKYMSKKSTEYQRERSKLKKYRQCIKSDPQGDKACGNLEQLKQNFDHAYKEMENAKQNLSDALSDYYHLRGLIKKLKAALKRILDNAGPKPSVEPRESTNGKY